MRSVLQVEHGGHFHLGDARQVPGLAALNVGGSAEVSFVSCPGLGSCTAAGSYIDGAGLHQAFTVTEPNGPRGQAPPGPGLIAPGAERARHHDTYVENLAWAADQAAPLGITCVIEPINTRDIPGFYLNTQAEAHVICAETGKSNVKVQMDFYHCQIVEGDLAVKLKQHFAGIGHIQIAGVPERHEPDIGEVNYPYLFSLMDQLGYDGWVGCEYRPQGRTSAGLGWIAPYLRD